MSRSSAAALQGWPEELEASDSVKAIVEAYFDSRAVPHMDKMIEVYSAKDGGLKRALSTLYKATNYSFEDYSQHLENLRKGRASSPTQRLLEIISRYSSGNLLNDDLVLRQCKALSNLSIEVLKKQIGVFYKNKTNEFLREKNPELYEEIRREEEGEEEIANDTAAVDSQAKRVQVQDDGAACSSAATPSQQASSPVAAVLMRRKERAPTK